MTDYIFIFDQGDIVIIESIVSGLNQLKNQVRIQSYKRDIGTVINFLNQSIFYDKRNDAFQTIVMLKHAYDLLFKIRIGNTPQGSEYNNICYLFQTLMDNAEERVNYLCSRQTRLKIVTS